MYEIDICGILIHAQPTKLEAVQTQLKALHGTEIHAVENGRIVLTVEGEIPSDDNPHPDNSAAEILKQIQQLQGVLSAAMIYQHCE